MMPNWFFDHLQLFLVLPFFDQVPNKGSAILNPCQSWTKMEESRLWSSYLGWVHCKSPNLLQPSLKPGVFEFLDKIYQNWPLCPCSGNYFFKEILGKSCTKIFCLVLSCWDSRLLLHWCWCSTETAKQQKRYCLYFFCLNYGHKWHFWEICHQKNGKTSKES